MGATSGVQLLIQLERAQHSQAISASCPPPWQPCRYQGVHSDLLHRQIGDYYIASSGASHFPALHQLILDIWLLEIRLGISLECVHIPGVVMIDQGTDGLSQGVWISSFHSLIHEQALLTTVFAPVPFDILLALSYILAQYQDNWFHYNYTLPCWDA
uniref:Uncharacterized protein n=1 Tax=Pseudo-nitzschia australis TaxID=44445 RepID=A0A7S4ARE6_9STRA|mmetsp:Transcript_20774/g.45226  ORF Transcript_20774/g.45226 Transcript_20774/m.45226 type:complete len:157 (-) Transcript_20774:2085-2555(-)